MSVLVTASLNVTFEHYYLSSMFRLINLSYTQFTPYLIDLSSMLSLCLSDRSLICAPSLSYLIYLSSIPDLFLPDSSAILILYLCI